MSSKVHIVGMGVLGSMCAWTLFREGIPFSWEDANARYVAWKASTGLIYPSGDSNEHAQYLQWARWYQGDAPWSSVASMRSVVEQGAFWFASKAPPHGGNYPIVASVKGLQLGSLPSYHLNPQEFVEASRAFFANQRQQGGTGTRKLIAHGYNQRLDNYQWGWSARVTLQLDQRVLLQSRGMRPSLYVRKNRFQLAYANPVPGTPFYYAGSAMFAQKDPHELSVEQKYQQWQSIITETGVVQVLSREPIRQGWRPAQQKGGSYRVTRLANGDLLVPPLAGSGVRLSPLVCSSLLEAL